MTYVIGSDKRTKSVSKEDTTRMMLRSATSRYGMKRTTSGRAKVKFAPRTPSLPKLKCLETESDA
jgi:hypothetical protein